MLMLLRLFDSVFPECSICRQRYVRRNVYTLRLAVQPRTAQVSHIGVEISPPEPSLQPAAPGNLSQAAQVADEPAVNAEILAPIRRIRDRRPSALLMYNKFQCCVCRRNVFTNDFNYKGAADFMVNFVCSSSCANRRG